MLMCEGHKMFEGTVRLRFAPTGTETRLEGVFLYEPEKRTWYMAPTEKQPWGYSFKSGDVLEMREKGADPTTAQEQTPSSSAGDGKQRGRALDELALSPRAYGALYRHGYRYAGELRELTVDDLARIPGMGPVTAREVYNIVREMEDA